MSDVKLYDIIVLSPDGYGRAATPVEASADLPLLISTARQFTRDWKTYAFSVKERGTGRIVITDKELRA